MSKQLLHFSKDGKNGSIKGWISISTLHVLVSFQMAVLRHTRFICFFGKWGLDTFINHINKYFFSDEHIQFELLLGTRTLPLIEKKPCKIMMVTGYIHWIKFYKRKKEKRKSHKGTHGNSIVFSFFYAFFFYILLVIFLLENYVTYVTTVSLCQDKNAL